jgi:DNA-binding MarR family transcriptional regulator
MRALIRRERSEHDQRVVQLFLTRNGSSVVANAPTPARGVVPDALGRISAATLTSLGLTLDALIGKLQVVDPDASSKPLSDI